MHPISFMSRVTQRGLGRPSTNRISIDVRKWATSFTFEKTKVNSTVIGGIRAQSTTSASGDNTNTPVLNSRPIYVAATQQHVGKTTTTLGLISGLKKRFPRSIGYMKPVGQQHVPVFSDVAGKDIRVDKDVTLIREHFNLQHLDYQDMSPVLIPKGYTKDYIDGKISHDAQLNSIVDAYNNIATQNEVVMCEGTG